MEEETSSKERMQLREHVPTIRRTIHLFLRPPPKVSWVIFYEEVVWNDQLNKCYTQMPSINRVCVEMSSELCSRAKREGVRALSFLHHQDHHNNTTSQPILDELRTFFVTSVQFIILNDILIHMYWHHLHCGGGCKKKKAIGTELPAFPDP